MFLEKKNYLVLAGITSLYEKREIDRLYEVCFMWWVRGSMSEQCDNTHG